jgi:hypothetical protein
VSPTGIIAMPAPEKALGYRGTGEQPEEQRKPDRPLFLWLLSVPLYPDLFEDEMK